MTNHNIRTHAYEAGGCIVRGRVDMRVGDWQSEKESFVYSNLSLSWEKRITFSGSLLIFH